MIDSPAIKRLATLDDYPFTKLNRMCQPTHPEELSFAAGEPTEPPTGEVSQALSSIRDFDHRYPPIQAELPLRESISRYLQRRFDYEASAERIAVTSGSREAIFSLISLIAPQGKKVITTNPYYQIYLGAATLANLPFSALSLSRLKHADEQFWKDCGVLLLCSPDNPTGTTLTLKDYHYFVDLAQRYGFYLIVDECYIDIHPPGHPPTGVLEALAANPHGLNHTLALFSLSKRSNLAGARSGAVVGSSQLIQAYTSYRNWYGVSMPMATQRASAIAWDEQSSLADRQQTYQARFENFIAGLGSKAGSLTSPNGSFYFWLKAPCDDVQFTSDLYHATGVKVVPGQWLSMPESAGDSPHLPAPLTSNPGQGFIRVAAVGSVEQCRDGGEKIAYFLEQNYPNFTF